MAIKIIFIWSAVLVDDLKLTRASSKNYSPIQGIKTAQMIIIF